jgi:hypothetical protein
VKQITAILTIAALMAASCSGDEPAAGAVAGDAAELDPIADTVPTAEEAAAAAEQEVTEANAAALLAEIEKEMNSKPN